MNCFKCKVKLVQAKSEYGFYYYCPKCGRKIETQGQTTYNSEKYKTRKDYKKY